MRRRLGIPLALLIAVLLVSCFAVPSVDAKKNSAPEFDGLAFVTYQDGVYRLVWSPADDDRTKPGSIAYDVFESANPDICSFDFSNPIASPVGVTGIDISGLDTQLRHYFVVRARDKEGASDRNFVEQADRLLRLTGQPNFRDFGGYINADGRQVRWGMLYRSGELCRLSASDNIVVGNLGLNTVFDLRSAWEVQKCPDPFAGDGDIYLSVPFTTVLEGVTNYFAFDPRTLDAPNMYWATAEGNKSQVKVLFDRLADASAYPVVEHCTGGKDRGGTTAALVLMLLDVPRDTIVRDYLMTCQVSDVQKTIASFEAGLAYYKDIVPAGVTIEDWLPFLGCSQVAIETLVDRINSEYGGISAYLKSCGVTAQQQRAIKANLLVNMRCWEKPGKD